MTEIPEPIAGRAGDLRQFRTGVPLSYHTKLTEHANRRGLSVFNLVKLIVMNWLESESEKERQQQRDSQTPKTGGQ
ncbi:MAG: hypothetical protein KDH88_19055 [Chromatiales bacterium]|nr:hypothetical protein [Chromatiales bacterium]